MYNHNFDGWVFQAMKDYNREKAPAYTWQTDLFKTLMVGLGRVLVWVGTKLIRVSGVSTPTPYPKTRPAG